MILVLWPIDSKPITSPRFYRIALILVQEYTMERNSDLCRLREKQPTASAATFRELPGFRVRVETPGPPAIGKERLRRKSADFRLARFHHWIGRFCFWAQ